MPRSRRTSLLLLVVIASACGGDDKAPTTTTTTSVQPCQANNTALVSFGNRSRATTQDIFWDGLRVATLTPGQDSAPITVTAGVAHRLEPRITNTTLLACAVSNPVPVQCSNQLYTCAFP